MTKIEQMWEALASYQSIAYAQGFGLEWAEMVKEKKLRSLIVAAGAAEDFCNFLASLAADSAAYAIESAIADPDYWAEKAIRQIEMAKCKTN